MDINNEQLIQQIVTLFKERNNLILTGYASQGGVGGTIPVRVGNKTEYAISLNVESPGNVNLVYADKQWYAFTEIIKQETRSTKITNRHYKDTIKPSSNYDFYLELLDFGETLHNKEAKIGSSIYALNKDNIITKLKDLLFPKTNQVKLDINQFELDYSLRDFKEYLISYSSSLVSFETRNKTYLEYINESFFSNIRYLRYLDTAKSVQLTRKSSNVVTMFTPFTIHRFPNFSPTSDPYTTDLRFIFKTRIPELARDPDIFNPNFILVWRLIEVEHSVARFGYGRPIAGGYITLDGRFIRLNNLSAFLGENSQTSYLDLSGIWRVGPEIYPAYLNIQIGGMDRSSLIIDPANYTGLEPTVKVVPKTARVLFPPPIDENGDLIINPNDARNMIPAANGEVMPGNDYIRRINTSTPFEV